MSSRLVRLIALTGALLLLGAPAYADRPDASARDTDLPLAGRVVVLDPGHQLGNHNFPRRIDRLVPDGRGGRKACNTTGTATSAGLAEATFVWRVARRVQARLERLGATVVLTRTSNSSDRWGPCVDARGRAGNKARADLELSIHGDGNLKRGARGFHVIAAPDRDRGSLRLARLTRAALVRQDLPVANYIAGGDGLDQRTDLATLNLSRVPTVMVELGNMRDRVDARRMASPAGRTTYARGLVAGVRDYLG
ncbi:N-acetylmuramoyl-L-alanine amidase [Nocardioides conyzicola]|uniref:N-acetylmuramoyl-L-alanine amidase n=1 Tax=Nocardioides conyzicola TaxID=1651781 RepID=A0ABP8XJA3_9ACTN